MALTGTPSTTWLRITGFWSTPRRTSAAWAASAFTPRTVWPITRPAVAGVSPRTWWRSSVICTTRYEGSGVLCGVHGELHIRTSSQLALKLFVLRSSIRYLQHLAFSQSQLTSGARRGTLWTGRHSVACC